MRKTLVWGAVFLCALLVSPAWALDGSAREDVRAALDEMHAWVGDGEKGQGWKRYLRSEDLRAQLARGREADVQLVSEILAQYSSDTPGLERPQFVAVREALQAWLEQLRAPAGEHSEEPGSQTSGAESAAGPAADQDDASVRREAPQDDLGSSQDQQAEPTVGKLSELFRAAKEGFAPVTERQVQKARARFAAALRQLENALSSSPTKIARGWKKYLNWRLLQRQLEREEGPDLAALQPVLESLSANHEGLERADFRALRDSLRDYMHAEFYESRGDLEADYRSQIESLASDLEPYTEDPSPQAAAAIGRRLGWLDTGGFAPPLVQALRTRYWHPNVHVQLSEQLLAAGIDDQVQQTSAVNQVILGTTICGTATLSGRVGVDLVPDADQASVDITLDGQAVSNNVGYNGPVTIYSNGWTNVDAHKRIYVDAERIDSAAAQAYATTSTRISSIAAHMKLIERIAWKRASRTKTQAEQIAAGRAASRIAGQMDQQAGELVEQASQTFQEKFRYPLLRTDNFPRQLRFQTSDTDLFVRILQVSPYQIAAAGKPPELKANHDFAVRMHHSLVGNVAESILGGETLTDERLVELLTEAEIEVPQELQISQDKEPWSITFAAGQPVYAEFLEDQVRLAIRGRSFTRRGQELRSTIEISAVYDLQKTGQRAGLTRQGDVAVDYVNRRRLGIREVAMKTFIRRKFEALFKPQLEIESVTLPGRWEKAGELQLQELQSGQGWITLAWQLPQSGQQPIRTAQTD